MPSQQKPSNKPQPRPSEGQTSGSQRPFNENSEERGYRPSPPTSSSKPPRGGSSSED